MPRYVAFLRAVNVGGRVLKMAQLQDIFGTLGYTGVESFIASGNIIFTTAAAPESTLVRHIETALQLALEYEVSTFIRTDAELALMARQKYGAFSEDETSRAHSLSIGLLHEPLAPEAVLSLQLFNTPSEELRPCGRELHMLAHASAAVSKFSLVKFEKRLGVRTTFRNVNTIVRLAARYPAGATP